jgi:signal transduction histidine kinase
MEHDAQIVIGPDGTVLAATGKLPSGLLDLRLHDCDVLSHEVRDTGKALLYELSGSRTRVASRTVALDGTGRSLQLIAIDAIPVRRTTTDIRELLTSKLSVMSFQASDAGVTLNIAVADDVPALLRLDSEKIAWAVTTLVGSALRYIRSAPGHFGGKTIDVRASYEPATSEVNIEVRDDGPGISTATVNRLFKHDGLNVRGAGLALLLIRDVMAAHGGRVDLRSSIDLAGHGTTIRLAFPLR